MEISITVRHLWNEDDTRITIFYKQLEELEARQSSEINIISKIKQPIFRVNVQEGADVTAKIHVENLISKVITGGTLKLTGKADVQDIDIRAAGKFQGENLKGKKVNISVIGGGRANINSKDYVNATTKAGGNIYIYGNPKNIDQKTTFGGTIKKIN